MRKDDQSQSGSQAPHVAVTCTIGPPEKGTITMNDMTNTHTVGDDRHAAQQVLKADLDLELANASAADKPFYRWLAETARAGRCLPSWGARPHLTLIAKEMAMTHHALTAAHGPAIERWQLRFMAAFDPDFALLGLPDIADVSVATMSDPSNPAYRTVLLQDLTNAAEGTTSVPRKLYDWLIAKAETGGSIPTVGNRPNAKRVAREVGIGASSMSRVGPLLSFWAPFFVKGAGMPFGRRTSLPETDGEGVEVPVAILLKSMRAALETEENRDARKLLAHLISIAEDDRTVPRFNKYPAFKTIRSDAGVASDALEGPIDRIFDEWIAFFHLDDHTTYTTANGQTVSRPLAVDEVTAFIQTLRAGGMIRLKREPSRGQQISSKWIARSLNLRTPSMKAPHVRAVIDAYVKECREHYGDGNELGEIFEGLPTEQKLELRAYRRDLVEWARKEVADGRKLPGSRVRKGTLDLDELVRRFGRTGPDLTDDDRFHYLIAQMKPKFSSYESLTVPGTYGQLIDQLVQDRLPSIGSGAGDPVKRKRSIAVTRSKIKGMIAIYAEHNGKGLVDAIGDDFADEAFAGTVSAVIETGAAGKQPKHWRGEMNKAKAFIDERSRSEAEDLPLHVILNNALVRSRRSLPSLAKASGLSEFAIRAMMEGTQLPKRDQLPEITRLEDILDIKGQISRFVERSGRLARKKTPFVLPAGVKPFLPDDYRRLSPEELLAMTRWIEDNLLHINTAFARGMSATQLQRLAKDGADKPSHEAAEAIGEQHPAIGRALAKQLAREGAQLGRRVVEELAVLVKHMTEFLPRDLDRRPGSFWKLDSTASMRLSMITRFLRWQVLPVEDGGLGRNPAHLTLGDLIHPPLVFAYLDYRARRNEHVEHEGRSRGKRFTGTDVDIVQTFKALVSETYGFVTQTTEMAGRVRADTRLLENGAFVGLDGHVFDEKENERVDAAEGKVDLIAPGSHEEIMPHRLANLRAEDFVAACIKAGRLYASAWTQLDTYADAGRDPAELIEGLLDSPRPMAVLLRQLALASQRIPSVKTDARSHHVFVRDLLMCRLLALTTLRSKNLREITVDGAFPQLRKLTPKGSRTGKKEWVLEIHWSEFKNFRSAVLFGRRRKRQPYRKVLPDTRGLYALLEYYIEVSRPYFQRYSKKAAHEALFLTKSGRPIDGPAAWTIVSRFTGRHVAWNPFREEGVPNVMPFGLHAFRDIRATDILLNPRTANPYLEAALALQSSPGMIQAHYGVIKTERRTAEDDITFLKSEDDGWAGVDTGAIQGLAKRSR